MRTGVLPVVLVAAAGAAGLTAAGVYQYFAAAQPDQAVVSSPPSSSSPGAEKSGQSFVMHDTPQIVPELSFVDGAGQQLSLADFRGKTILLNVWATWCVPCRKEMPSLDRLQAKLGGPGFEVVPLSIDRDGLPKVRAFYNELGLKAVAIYVDTSGAAAYRLGAVGIPTTLLIDPNGLEAGRLVGPAEWDSPQVMKIIQQQLEEVRNEAS